MNLYFILYLGIGVVYLAMGLYQLITHERIGKKLDGYTDESVALYIPKKGIAYLLVSVGAFLCAFADNGTYLPMPVYFVGWFFIVAAIIFDGYYMKHLLVEKRF